MQPKLYLILTKGKPAVLDTKTQNVGTIYNWPATSISCAHFCFFLPLYSATTPMFVPSLTSSCVSKLCGASNHLTFLSTGVSCTTMFVLLLKCSLNIYHSSYIVCYSWCVLQVSGTNRIYFFVKIFYMFMI